MKLRRAALLAILAALAALGTFGAASASAAPIWNLDIHHNQTNFSPGGTAEYWFDSKNLGDAPTTGPITLTIDLPAGLTAVAIHSDVFAIDGFRLNWNCPAVAGASTIVCTATDTVPRHRYAAGPLLEVDVAPGACDPDAECDLTTTATLSGGAAATVSDAEPTHVSPAPAPFGIVASSFRPGFFEADGLTPVRASGAHPYQAFFPFDFNTVDRPGPNPGDDPDHKLPTENIRNLRVDLPPGFIGDPNAVPECTPGQLNASVCPRSSQVGVIDFTANPLSSDIRQGAYTSAVFNMDHPRGVITDLAFIFANNPVHIKAALDPARNYAIQTTVSSINETLPVFDQKLTIWGVPADPSHDSERCGNTIDTTVECPSTAPRQAFLTVPFQCGVDHQMRLHHYDSWENPGIFGPDITYTLPGHTTACDRPVFEPSVEINPTGRQANTPTGIDVSIQLPQNANANALAVPPVKSTVVTFPEGMTLNPAFADGLGGCTLAQIGLGTDDPVACPDNSRIGEVFLTTTLLPKPLEGSMYLAKQTDNFFGSTFAMYMAVHDNEERGILVKIPGKIELDPQTGHITTTFDDLPQFPFSDFTLSFRSGERAPLVNPPACGAHTIAVKIASYAQPDTPIDASNTYEVTQGPGGGPCPPDAAGRPFAPKLSAGTLNPVAGSFSPFIFRLTRTDSDQELSQVQSILPPGLLAKIAGIPFCPEAAIAAIPTAEATGQSEFDLPHCPPASQIGAINTGVGSGTGPNYFIGKVYLAGPYKGAPLSLVTVVPALAGPYDLGNVLVRVAVRVDPETSRVTAVSDPFPTILHGVILRVRDVRLRLDRPETTLNPTNCSPSRFDAAITGVGADLFSTADDSLFLASDRFQVGDCGRLAFKPKIFFKLKGGTHRGDHPAFFSRVRARPGDANFAKAIVALPRSEFLENAHIGTVCTRVQFRADACPPDSIYGHAKAITPLLDDPVEGDLVLRSSDHPLPDLVARLRGQISANLVGRIDSVNGGIRSSFETIPDVPVTEFTLTMLGGKKGLLVNSRNLCKAPARADVKFTAQSGKFLRLRPVMQTSCKKPKKAKRHRRARP